MLYVQGLHIRTLCKLLHIAAESGMVGHRDNNTTVDYRKAGKGL